MITKKYLQGEIINSANDGIFTIINDTGWREVHLIFIETGYVSKASRNQIKNGQVKDRFIPRICGVGFIGGTKHKSKIGKNDNPHYQRWVHMLKRCYCEKTQKRKPSYIGCSVSEEWHNFQNYAEWCEQNYVEGCELDKDILVNGNRIYSSETCKFVTHQENSEASTAKYWHFLSPAGELTEIYNLNKFCINNDLTAANMKKVYVGQRSHHKGWRKASRSSWPWIKTYQPKNYHFDLWVIYLSH